MKISAQQLPQQLRGDKIPPLFWVAGDESLLTQEASDNIRRHCLKLGFEEREVWHADNTMDWQGLLLSANSLSLFASKKIIELRFSSGKPGDKALKALAGYLSRPNSDCAMLVTSPKLDSGATRSKTFKHIEAAALLIQVWPVDGAGLPQWIAARLQRQGFSCDRAALDLLSERVEGNLLAAQQEIDKLTLLAEDGQAIDEATVERCVADSARYNVFDLSEPMLKGDSRSVQRITLGLREEGAEATIVLWNLCRDIRRLITVRQALDRGQRPESAMEKQGIWKKQQPLYSSAAARLTSTQLARALTSARDVDLGIKGMTVVDPWRGLLSLALQLAGTELFKPAIPASTNLK